MVKSYLPALLGANLRAAYALRKRFLGLSGVMFLQNSMFFAIWIIFFGTTGSVRGWTLADLAIFHGTLNVGIGLAFFFGDGARKFGNKVVSGELDAYLTRPRRPLPQLILGQTNPTSLGDMAFGLCLLLGVARLDLAGFGLALLAAILIGGLFIAATVILQTLAFFITSGERLADQLFDMLLCLGTIPQHTQGLAMKLLLFTALPAGFMVIVPVELVRRESFGLLAVLAAAVAGYALLAVAIFNFGLRRYTSATGWKV